MAPGKEHPVRITNQFVALVAIVLTGLVGLVVSLAVWADWSDGAIVGMVSAFGTIAAGLIVTVRNQQATQQTLARQDDKLETIEKQTNGLAHQEREDIARRAALAALEEVSRRGDAR